MIFYFCIVENITKHIEKLLAQHDYVVVPGFGGFLVRKESAKILADRIVPPVATISFNPLMQHADGLLAIEISKAEQISYRQAVDYLDTEVRKYMTKVTNTKSGVAFGNLGHIKLSESGLLLFQPAENADFLPGNFMLNELNVQPRYYRVERSVSPSGHRIAPKIYRYAAVVLALTGLFLATQKVNDAKRADYAGLIPAFSVPVVADTIHPKRVADKRSESTLTHVAGGEKSKESSQSVKSHSFHVVISSVGCREAANKLCEQLKKEHYNSATVLATEKTFRTSLKSFDNLDAALEYMKKIRKTDERFQNAWVKCN